MNFNFQIITNSLSCKYKNQMQISMEFVMVEGERDERLKLITYILENGES